MGTWAFPSGPRSRALPYLAGAGLTAILAASGGCGWGTPGSSEPVPVDAVMVTAGTSAFCTIRPLSELCSTAACPQSEADVALLCGLRDGGATTNRYVTPCGGSVVEHDFVSYGYAQRWYFDASGALVGATNSSSTPACGATGPGGPIATWGMVCPPTIAPRDLCIEACPIGTCVPRAHILVDSPALSDAGDMGIVACRSGECFSANIPAGLELGQTFQLAGTLDMPSDWVSVTVWFGPGSTTPLELHLTWELLQLDFPEQDRYQINLSRAGQPRPGGPVLDTQVTYERADLGCGGTCRVADLDLRAAATMAP